MKWFYSVAMLFLLTVCASGDEWKACAKYDNAGVGTTITDIERHYKPLSFMQSASTYRNPGDYINWSHELTHAVNSLIRNTFGNSDTHQAVYCLDDLCYVFSTPKCNLKDVRNRVKNQGYSYQLYFVQQMSDWGHQPLYPLDELQAYTNGTVAGLEKYGPNSSVRFSLERAEEFNYYAQVVVQTIQELDPSYKDLSKLQGYVDQNAEQLRGLRAKF